MEVDLLPGQETRDAVQLHGDRLQVLTAEEIFLGTSTRDNEVSSAMMLDRYPAVSNL